MKAFGMSEAIYASEKKHLIAGMFRRESTFPNWLEAIPPQVVKKQYAAEPGLQIMYAATKLAEIQKEIQKSKYILDLADNWDDEGSRGYQMSTWQRATSFLFKLSLKAWESFRVAIDAPKIYHGPNGSIDMLWKTDKYQILANFPDDPSLPATFYGNDSGKDSLEGTFDPTSGGCNLLMLLIGKSVV